MKAFYFPINVEVTTDFFPGTSEGQIDAQVEDMFHTCVRKNGETSYLAYHTGRRLLPVLRKLNADVRRRGRSSWVVYPKADSRYNADEVCFLKCILIFIEYRSGP